MGIVMSMAIEASSDEAKGLLEPESTRSMSLDAGSFSRMKPVTARVISMGMVASCWMVSSPSDSLPLSSGKSVMMVVVASPFLFASIFVVMALVMSMRWLTSLSSESSESSPFWGSVWTPVNSMVTV